MTPAPLRYVAVEGPIGAGKTSLARRLAHRLGAELLLEEPGENPFLARFYENMARYALPTQLFFLFQRARALEPLAQPELFGRPTVADFLLDKDPLFARITLSEDELALYRKIYDALRPQTPVPDLVVYLQARPATSSSASAGAGPCTNARSGRITWRCSCRATPPSFTTTAPRRC
jgi:deoxyadenosine/deoxycytidine kinase